MNTFVSGAGFLADAYDIFVVNVAIDIMRSCKYSQSLSTSKNAILKSISLIGAIVGQVTFGAAADVFGRKKLFIVTCCMVIFGSIASSLIQDNMIVGIYDQLTIYRFILGIGIGTKTIYYAYILLLIVFRWRISP